MTQFFCVSTESSCSSSSSNKGLSERVGKAVVNLSSSTFSCSLTETVLFAGLLYVDVKEKSGIVPILASSAM